MLFDDAVVLAVIAPLLVAGAMPPVLDMESAKAGAAKSVATMATARAERTVMIVSCWVSLIRPLAAIAETEPDMRGSSRPARIRLQASGNGARPVLPVT